MKKKIIAGLLLSTFITTNYSPALAFWHIGVQKNNSETPIETQKTVKNKKVKWTDLKVQNKYDYINYSWWEKINDNYLCSYIERAIEHNHNAKIASLTVDEYYQNVKMQFSAELPSLSAGLMPSYGGTKSNGDFNMIIPIIASYELDIFGKNHNKTTSMKKLYEASIQDERATYISIVSAVGTTYFNIIQLDKLIQNQKEIVSLRQNIYDTKVLANKEGILSTFEVVRANKDLIRGQNQLIDLEKARINMLNQLAVLIGESPANIDSLERSKYEDIAYKYNMPDEISSEVITQRPDYLKSEIMLKKAGIDVKVARKELLPVINIGGLAAFNLINANQSPLTSFIYGLGGGILADVYAGGRKVANLKKKKIVYEKMLQSYRNTNLTSIQELNDAMYAYKSSNQKYEQNVKSLNLELEDYNLSNKKFEEGVISKLELNQKKENLLNIQNLVVQNKIACIIDSIGIYKATGSGENKTLKFD